MNAGLQMVFIVIGSLVSLALVIAFALGLVIGVYWMFGTALGVAVGAFVHGYHLFVH